MTKFIKLISLPLFSLAMLIGLTGAGNAETTVSAEVGFIFNMWFLSNVHGSRFRNA